MTRATKGFDAKLQCRGFQFESGKTYTHDGPVKACSAGFHAIPEDVHPLVVFDYYAPAGSRFCVVDVSGAMDRGGDKIAAEILSVGDELTASDLVAEAVAWVSSRTEREAKHATGDRSAASATGYQSAASATGDRSAASATGDRSAASATGNQSAASATGDRSAASATGYQSAASATGDRSAASATGDRSAASATGNQSAASALHAKSGAYNTGYGGRVLGVLGAALHADERAAGGAILSVASGIVGQNGIDPGVWYICRDWKLVPA